MKANSITGVLWAALLAVPVLGGEAFAQAQTQTVQYAVNNTTTFSGWNSSCCYGTTYERCGNNSTFSLSWTDQINSNNVRIEVRFEWGTCCVGSPTYTVTLNNGSAMTADSPQPSGLNATPAADCTCRQTSFQVSGTNYTLPATNNYAAGGTNTLVFNFANNSGCNLCLANNTSGWCAQVTIVGLNQPPAAPTNVHQAAVPGGSGQALGFISDSTIYFRATVSDPNASNTVGLQVEVLPAATAFGVNPTGTLISTPTASYVSSGSIAEAELNFITANLPSGSYHWRARARDNIGAAGPWVVFNAATVHFTTDLVPPTTPGGPYSPGGVQLVFENVPEGSVPFTWGTAFDPSGPPLPVQYRLEVSTSDTFATLVYDTIVDTVGHTALLPASENIYFWRVSARDVAGNSSAPSTSSIFQVAWTVPPVKNDRFAGCGVSTAGGSALMAGLAALSLLGFAARRRRKA